MSLNNKILELIEEGERLQPLGGSTFGGFNSDHQSEYVSWRLLTISLLENLGEKGKLLLKEIERDQSSPYLYESSVINILGVLKAALELVKQDKGLYKPQKKQNMKKLTDTVFWVHGRDQILLQQTARFLEGIDITTIILFEQPSKGQTIIEKLESNSEVSFAVVLLTPDDVGKLSNETKELKPRARQNVILELGFFIGKLGRNNVSVLYDESVELPSDYRGVEYIKIDTDGAWRLKLAKEMKHAGLDIDMNKAI